MHGVRRLLRVSVAKAVTGYALFRARPYCPPRTLLLETITEWANRR